MFVLPEDTFSQYNSLIISVIMRKKQMEADIEFIRQNVDYLYELVESVIEPLLLTQRMHQLTLNRMEKKLKALEIEVFGDDSMFN